MSFGALAAWQGWLLIAAAGAAAWLLFRMKVRPPRVIVPSLVVWRRVFDQAAELTWWERVRRAVSLGLTVLIALAIGMAVARPGPRVTATAGRGRVLIVLDSSWSMRARAGGQTRWDRAVAEARALAESATSDVALATTADGLVEGPTSDLALIGTALDRLAPAGGEGSAWPRVEGVESTHFITDGALDRPVASGTVIHSVYEPAANVAITAFGARPATSSLSSAAAYLEVANYAPAAQTVHLTVTRDASVLTDRRVELKAGEVTREILPLAPTGGARLRARVSAPDNALDIDDEAVAWLALADPLSVVVVSEQPQALADLFKHDPNVHATLVKPAAYKPDDADVLIFDRWLPAEPPARPALCLTPPTSAWLGKIGREELGPQWIQSREHPILDGVDPLTLDIVKVRAYDAVGLTPVVVSGKGTPLVSVLDASARRAVVLGFGVAESNFAAAPAFPVLVGNALEWLARPAAGEPRTPGPMALPASTTKVTSPDGAPVPLVRAGDRVLVRLQMPGLYLVETGGSQSVVGVNVGNPDIANLSRTTLSESQRATGAALGLAGRPWWMYGVLAAFLLLSIEWLTWQRRVTV